MANQDPQSEVTIDEQLVKRLLRDQFPEFANLPIRFLDAGWDNESYRIGEHYIARLPRRQLAVELLQNEISWLPRLKDQIPIPIPFPVKIGQPGNDYPWPWSIVPWYEGQTAGYSTLGHDAAGQLLSFFRALHQPEPENAPVNDYRGIHLSEREEAVAGRMKFIAERTNLVSEKLKNFWQQALAEPLPTARHLIHGDLHPRNVLVHEGKISAIIDWGDITSGDIANDYSAFWMLFDEKAVREKALETYGVDESLRKRSIGWAIYFAVMFLDSGVKGNELHNRIGKAILKAIESE